METLRCPTCLTLLLDGGEKRCPGCHSKLRKRSQPIVLGESSRLASRPALPVEREMQARVQEEQKAEDRRRRKQKKADRKDRASPANGSEQKNWPWLAAAAP